MQAPAFAARCHEEVAGADEALLVRKRNRCPAINGCKRGLQSGRATHRGHQPVGRARSSLDDRAFADAALDTTAGERILQLAKARGIGDRHKPRVEFPRQFGKALDVGIRRKRFDTVAAGRAAQQIHRTVADRPGRSQNRHGPDSGLNRLVIFQRNGTHTSPNHKGVTDAIRIATQKSEKRGDNNRRYKAVEAVEQPAVSRNDLTGVLDPETPLDRQLK